MKLGWVAEIQQEAIRLLVQALVEVRERELSRAVFRGVSQCPSTDAVRDCALNGGGTQNRQLCQMTADACDRAVIAGPVEATAIGNLMTQAVADGAIGSIAEARQVIRHSFDLAHYEPNHTAAWDEAFARFLALN